MILQVEDAVSAEDCRRLITIYDRHLPLTKVSDYSGHPVVYWDQLRDSPEAAEIVPRLVQAGEADLGEIGADRRLPGNEGATARGAALLAVPVGEDRALLAGPVDCWGCISP
jgi:hypothetical protein